MKKIIAISCALLLTSCATTGGGPATDPSVVIGQTTAIVKQIIAGTIKACAYQPDAAAISALLASFVPGAAPAVGIANQVISAICAQVTALGGPRGAEFRTPVVNGVPITGHFVQSRRR